MAILESPIFKSVSTIVSIFLAGFFIKGSLVSTMEELNKPLIEKVSSIETRIKNIESDIASYQEAKNFLDFKINTNNMCLSNITEFVNAHFNREFIKPEDIINPKSR